MPIPFVPLRPLIIDFEVTVPVAFNLAGRIVFDQAMNTGVLPALGTFTLTIDGSEFDMTPVAWTGDRRLDCNTVGSPPVVNAYVRQNFRDPNCYSLLGTFARPQANVQWFP